VLSPTRECESAYWYGDNTDQRGTSGDAPVLKSNASLLFGIWERAPRLNPASPAMVEKRLVITDLHVDIMFCYFNLK